LGNAGRIAKSGAFVNGKIPPYRRRVLGQMAANESEVEIELVGDIATMVELTIPKKAVKEATLCPELRRSVKVVAGVGFEPTTFRL
jgi:hypothetical protein